MAEFLKKSDEVDAIAEIAQLVCRKTGIQLTEKHSEMVRSRLQRRLIELGLRNAAEYLEYVHTNPPEMDTLVGLLTTHHTFFFREFVHFEHLRNHALPALIPVVRARPGKKIRVWSAACSRGQEAYSLAMFLDFTLKTMAPDVGFEILGTDVDPDSVRIAGNGVYRREELKSVPATLLGDHWSRGTGEIADYVKARPGLRERVRFETRNLIDLKGFSPAPFDIVFCRNVFIYFTPEQIKSITTTIQKWLAPEAYFYIGISENLNGLGLGLRSVGPSVFTNAPVKAKEVAPASVVAGSKKTPAPASPSELAQAPVMAADRKLRVLCVDDSPTVLALLKQILSADPGFEVVGTAKNGIEAAERLKTVQADLMTLDIHMPEQNGVEYLAKNFRAGHPPVVMVSSVSRDNAELALQAMESGAADYVEKPTLSNLKEKGEEIRTKLRCAFDAAKLATSAPRASQLDRDFARVATIAQPERKLRMIYFTFSSRAVLKQIVSEWKGAGQPPLVLWAEGAKDSLPKMAILLERQLGKKVEASDTVPTSLLPDRIYLLDSGTQGAAFHKAHSVLTASILVVGEVTPATSDQILAWAGAQLVIEDRGPVARANRLSEAASDVVPLTSFAYQSSEFLCRK